MNHELQALPVPVTPRYEIPCTVAGTVTADGTHTHGVDLRIPGAPPIGVGYVERPGELVELDAVTARETMGDNGLPMSTTIVHRPGGLTADIDIRGHAPLLLTSPDSRLSHLPRAWAAASVRACGRHAEIRHDDAHVRGRVIAMVLLKSITLFALAALLEIGGAWLVWQGVREHRGLLWVGSGIIALGAYGFVAAFQPDPHFGRVLAAYGGVFIGGSLIWAMVADGFRPDRWDVLGAAVCLAGVGVIMYAPR
ncbi:drug/metabolite transporter superfamily protein YnfA [Mycobacterium sp. URHB0021]